MSLRDPVPPPVCVCICIYVHVRVCACNTGWGMRRMLARLDWRKRGDMKETSPYKNLKHRDAVYLTGWRRLIGSSKLQIIFHKRFVKYKSLLRKMTYKDQGSYESSPPCTNNLIKVVSLLPVVSFEYGCS